MPYKVLIIANPRKTQVAPTEGWQFSHLPDDIGGKTLGDFTHLSQGQDHPITQYIGELKPDFVLFMCDHCTEDQVNQMLLPKGPKYISWSTDSYRHAKRVTNTDLHLSGIPDSALLDTDHFLPLYSEKQEMIPWNDRKHLLGISCKAYFAQSLYREKEINKVKKTVDGFYRVPRILSEEEYSAAISDFKYGLNIAVYEDSLPNYRSFELGRAGVIQICKMDDIALRKELFCNYTLYYNEISEIPEMLEYGYDPHEVKLFFDLNHSFEARLSTLFKKYFNINFIANGLGE